MELYWMLKIHSYASRDCTKIFFIICTFKYKIILIKI